MSTSAPSRRTSLGAQLERTRLEHRERRVQRALHVLRERRTNEVRPDDRRAALDQAISGFRDELTAIRTRMRSLRSSDD